MIAEKIGRVLVGYLISRGGAPVTSLVSSFPPWLKTGGDTTEPKKAGEKLALLTHEDDDHYHHNSNNDNNYDFSSNERPVQVDDGCVCIFFAPQATNQVVRS